MLCMWNKNNYLQHDNKTNERYAPLNTEQKIK